MFRVWFWCLSVLANGTLVVPVSAQQDAFSPKPFDWPQWQGPNRDSISREAKLLQSWPKEGPPLLWKCKNSGGGCSTPSVAAGRIFLMGNIDRTEYVICLSEKNGNELWKTEVSPPRRNNRDDGWGGWTGGSCSTPTVDGDRVYALGQFGDLLCLSIGQGKVHWRKDLCSDFNGPVNCWYCESPLVDGSKLLVTPGGEDNSIVALDKMNGNTIWSTKVPESGNWWMAPGYASIIKSKIAGLQQYVKFMNAMVVGISATDGKFLWSCKVERNGGASMTTPIIHGDTVLTLGHGKGECGCLLKISHTNDGYDARQVYKTGSMRDHHGGMVLIDGYLYGRGNGELCCLEYASGKVMWHNKVPGNGSITAAGGCIYYRNETGDLFLVAITPQRYVQLGTFPQPNRSNKRAWAHPVIANGYLYIADQELLLCYDVKKK